MKKVWEFLKNFVIITYILLIIFITICLLSYNKYKVTVFGKNTFLPIIDEDLEPDYKYGDLLIIKRNNLSTVKEGDVVFFYRTVAGITTVNYATVISNERVTDTETTFTIKDGLSFSSSYFIGKADTAIIIPKVGKLIGLLESKWGFLFLGVLPSLVAFLFTIRSVISEIRGDDEEENNNDKNSEKNSSIEKTLENKSNDENKIDDKKENATDEKDDLEELEKVIIEEKPKENSNNALNNEKDENEKVESNDTTESIYKTNKENEQNEQNGKDNIEVNKSEVNNNEVIQNLDTETKDKTDTEKKNIKNKTEEEKKALIQDKINSMTEEEKKALIQAKLNSMTDEQKKALIEAKRKKSSK